MVGLDACRRQLTQAASEADVILVEGMMGLYDGTPSSADLACGTFTGTLKGAIEQKALGYRMVVAANDMDVVAQGFASAGAAMHKAATALATAGKTTAKSAASAANGVANRHSAPVSKRAASGAGKKQSARQTGL